MRHWNAQALGSSDAAFALLPPLGAHFLSHSSQQSCRLPQTSTRKSSARRLEPPPVRWGIGRRDDAAGSFWGGRVFTVTDALGPDIDTDLGGELINTDHEDMLALADEFGVELVNGAEQAQWQAFPQSGYVFDGISRPEEEVARALGH
jgi:hypothetical protein